MDSMMNKNKVSFFDYLYLIAKWRKILIINFFTICIITAIISLIIPKWYKANSTILPPKGDDNGLNFSSIISNLPISGLGIGMGGASEDATLVLAVVKSRTVMESVVKKFNLIERYKSENMEEAVKTLRENVEAEITDEGTIVIRAIAKTTFFANKDEENETRTLVTNMANFVVDEIDRINRYLRTDKARNKRIFIEKRYLQNLSDLEKAENEFKAFQEEYGMINLEEQTKATITAAAEIKAKIIAKEVQVSVLSRFVDKKHSDLILAKTEMDELKRKYDQLNKASDKTLLEKGTVKQNDLFLSLEDMPDIGLKYVRLYRELKLQETILEFMLPQYEQAKIQEASDTSTIQIIDKAIKPIKRIKPKRAFMVIGAGFLSIIFFVIIVYVYVNIHYIKETDNNRYDQMRKIVSEVLPQKILDKYVK